MTLITIYKLNVRTLNVHSNTIKPFSKIWTFQHFYKSTFSVRWEQNVEIGMVGKKRCEVYIYNTIYNEYILLYIIYNIQYKLYNVWCIIYCIHCIQRNSYIIYYIVSTVNILYYSLDILV